jgi:hypothetical protein
MILNLELYRVLTCHVQNRRKWPRLNKTTPDIEPRSGVYISRTDKRRKALEKMQFVGLPHTVPSESVYRPSMGFLAQNRLLILTDSIGLV